MVGLSLWVVPLPGTGQAKGKVDVSVEHDAEKIAPGVFLTYSPQPTSYTGVVAMVVAKADGVMVVDTGVADYMPAALLPALAALGVDLTDITTICSTHGHFDHSGGSRALHEISNAPIYLSANDEAYSRQFIEV